MTNSADFDSAQLDKFAVQQTIPTTNKQASRQRVWRQAGCLLADSLVVIW